MKKIHVLIYLLISIFIFPQYVNAASASISVAGNNTAVVGNKITLNVVLSSGTPIGSWEMLLNYDSSYLQFVGGGGEDGGMSMAASSSGTKSKKYSFTFKTLKAGNTTVKVGSYLVYAFADMSEMSVSNNGKSLRIITQAELEASYSKDNSLKSLGAEGFQLNEEFSKDKLEYTVDVPEGTTSVNIQAVKNDANATITGDGVKEVNPGTNTFEIIVKAQNGVEKVYKINVNVVDKNPISVKLGSKNYTLVKFESGIECPKDYEKSMKKINEVDIPVCYNKTINYTLVGVKDENGNISLAKYDSKKYEEYSEINSGTLIIIPLNIDKEIKGYKKYNIKIDGKNIQVLKRSEESKTSIVYGLNISNNKKSYYIYDNTNKTMVEYDSEYVTYLENNNKYLLYASISFATGLFISFISLICVNKKKKNKNKIKNNKEVKEVKKEVKISNTIEDNSSEDVYNIFEDDKKSKKKKKK